MDSTSASLLLRLRRAEDQTAWRRFVALYSPLIYHWAQSQGLNPTDAAELVQEVMVVMVARLPELEYDPQRRFRGWLRTVTVNKARDLLRRRAVRPASGHEDSIERLAAAEGGDLFEETEFRDYLVGRALELMQAEFRPQTWQACWKHVALGQPAAEVARELGMSVNAVHVAKCRVLRRLRTELAGLVD